MKVLFIARSTLFTSRGGDTVQVVNTAAQLSQEGVETDIRLTHEAIDYARYDLLHFFNVTRPADICYHIRRSGKPFVVSPILVDYTQYDQYYRKGLSGLVFRLFPPHLHEYAKTIARWIKGTDSIKTFSYIWKGQQKSIREIVSRASALLPNSAMERAQLSKLYPSDTNRIVPNGINPGLFTYTRQVPKKSGLVLCVARIEGLKNQLNLIKGMNGTAYELVIIGSPAVNQYSYYEACKRSASANVRFIDHLPQEELVRYYQLAKVHVLPSWFETCGLSSLEAAAMGCNIVITEKGYTREYYEDYAFYCDPASPDSIREAVDQAAKAPVPEGLRHKIIHEYTWQIAAKKTAAAYRQVIPEL
jgi:glycosyltransferase involved in cell wall biosynthesis